MADSRDVRRLAFQLLFQIDAADTSGGADANQLAAGSEDAERLRPAERSRAAKLASDAYLAREGYDNTAVRIAPGWPAHRQPAVDRAIIRLAQHELAVGDASVAVIISEAVELAKEFGTEKSPGFVNAVVDRIAKDRAGAPAPTTSIDAVGLEILPRDPTPTSTSATAPAAEGPEENAPKSPANPAGTGES